MVISPFGKKIGKCSSCEYYKVCSAPCKEVEKLLWKGTHSIKSNYIIKYFDPNVLEQLIDKEAMQELHGSVGDEAYDTIRKVLQHLTPVERRFLKLHYGIVDGKPVTQTQISKAFNVSQHTVHWHISRAKSKVRKYIEKWHSGLV